MVTLLVSGAWVEGNWDPLDMMWPTDFGSNFSKVKYGPVGSGRGLNSVTIAYSDFGITKNSDNFWVFSYINYIKPNEQFYEAEMLIADIETVHRQGGKVKVSFGGNFLESSYIRSIPDADIFAMKVVQIVKQNKIDGVDIYETLGKCSHTLQVYLLQQLREMLPAEVSVSLSVQAGKHKQYPFNKIIQNAEAYLTSINFMSYGVATHDLISDLQEILDMGVPAHKIVVGVKPGCSFDLSERTDLEDAKLVAEQVKQFGLGGVLLDIISRDTNHKRDILDDCTIQSDLPDGTFIKMLAEAFAENTAK